MKKIILLSLILIIVIIIYNIMFANLKFEYLGEHFSIIGNTPRDWSKRNKDLNPPAYIFSESDRISFNEKYGDILPNIDFSTNNLLIVSNRKLKKIVFLRHIKHNYLKYNYGKIYYQPEYKENTFFVYKIDKVYVK